MLSISISPRLFKSRLAPSAIKSQKDFVEPGATAVGAGAGGFDNSGTGVMSFSKPAGIEVEGMEADGGLYVEFGLALGLR
jgi:hypothetical protein